MNIAIGSCRTVALSARRDLIYETNGDSTVRK